MAALKPIALEPAFAAGAGIGIALVAIGLGIKHLAPGAKTLSCWHQYLDECPPDRGRNPRCFNGLPTAAGSPQITIVCQQIRGIPYECFSNPRPAASPTLGGLIHKPTNTL